MLYCREWGPIAAVWQRRPHGQFHRSHLTPFLLVILSRHTTHNSAKPKSNDMPTTYPTEYLRQYLADEDIWNHHPLHMYGGQTAVPCGRTYLLPWGRRFMAKQQNMKKN